MEEGKADGRREKERTITYSKEKVDRDEERREEMCSCIGLELVVLGFSLEPRGRAETFGDGTHLHHGWLPTSLYTPALVRCTVNWRNG